MLHFQGAVEPGEKLLEVSQQEFTLDQWYISFPMAFPEVLVDERDASGLWRRGRRVQELVERDFPR